MKRDRNNVLPGVIECWTHKIIHGSISDGKVFFRCFFGLLALIPVLIYNGFTQLKTTHLSGHVWRTVAGIAAAYCFFFALANMPLAEAVLFNFTAPLFIPFVAYFWLKERVGWSVRAVSAKAGSLPMLEPQ